MSFGLRNLSPADSRYGGRYGGGPADRDGAYHQGSAWAWLVGPFAGVDFRVTGERARA